MGTVPISARLATWPSQGCDRVQQPQGFGFALDPILGAEGPLALNARSNRFNFSQRLRFVDIGHPVLRQRYGRLRELDPPWALHCAPSQATPIPVFRACNQPST